MSYLVLRTVSSDGQSYHGFRWPLEVGARVEAPDWSPEPECGHGLHGLLWGEGDGILLDWDHDAKWLVCEIEKYIDLDGKVKFPSCVIKHVGNRLSATSYLLERAPDLTAVIGATVTKGHKSTAIVGAFGEAIVGDYGTATTGNDGTATAGDFGTATAGNYGIATVGADGTATAGYQSTATTGNNGTATAGYRGTATTGKYGVATAGAEGKATAGNYGKATAGNYGTATAGSYGTATAGSYGTATAGYRGTLRIAYWDDKRQRWAIGYIGEDGLEPNVAYKVAGNAGKFYKA